MSHSLIAADGRLEVEGHSESKAVGSFKGLVVAILVRHTDPVAAAGTNMPSGTGTPESMDGEGTTHFLVADPDKPAPVWVSKGDVESHSFEPVASA